MREREGWRKEGRRERESEGEMRGTRGRWRE